MLARMALWVIAGADLIALIYHVVRERRLHPEFLQERLDHQILVIAAGAMLAAQIGAVGLALTSVRRSANTMRKAVAALILGGAAMFNAASFSVVAIQFWDLGTTGSMSMPPPYLAIFIVWVLANLFGFVASLRRRPWATAPVPAPEGSRRIST